MYSYNAPCLSVLYDTLTFFVNLCSFLSIIPKDPAYVLGT
jgi:hypothetical protein